MKIAPDTPVAALPWIPKNRASSLAKLGLHTAADLAHHFPRRHEDRRRFAPFPCEETDSPVLLCGIVAKASYLPYGRWRRGFEATLEDDSPGGLGARVVCRWFNMPYIAKAITTGMRMVAYGRVRQKGKRLVLDFPEFEMLDEEASSERVHLDRIVPVHPAGEGVAPRKLREWIHRALAETDLAAIPPAVPGLASPPERAGLLKEIHFPSSPESLESARRRLAEEELFAMQVVIGARRASLAASPGTAKTSSATMLANLVAALPFEPTAAQCRAIAAIRADMESEGRMNRLLQGDVGSGKTLVALAAAALALEAGHGVAVMAPTQILAEQHHATFSRALGPMGVDVALRTGSTRERGEGTGFFGRPGVVIGTHALLYGSSNLGAAGLVVIDEQHKFGVLQRAALAAFASAPDILVMTATPIPRTLAQTVYGDLDVTVIDELPPGRQRIATGVRPRSKLADAASFLRDQLGAGRQAYIVYPLVEESEKLSAKAAAAEFERWRELLAPHPCALIHGRLPAPQKAEAMRDFADGRAKALIATSVIEVGVDVPNATVMLVENAERFGLAQLHQLRGRVGRGEHKSYFILMPGDDSPDVMRRLSVLERTSDGFEVAEADLRFRGPGDLLGTAQTGLPPLRVGDLLRDADLVSAARDRARALFRSDPSLARPENAALRAWLDQRAADPRPLAG